MAQNCGCGGTTFETELQELVAFVEKDHDKLYNRDKAGQHTIEAIEGLQEALDSIGGFIVAYPLNDRLELGPTWLSETEDGEPFDPEEGRLYCLGADSVSYPTNALFRWGGESYIPVVAGGGSIPAEIEDPSDRDVLLYDEDSEVWKNYKLVDDNSLIYLNENGGLSIKHYEDAKQGQMLVKDNTEGLYWVDPVSDQSLQEATTRAQNSALQAGTSAVQSGNYAADSLQSAIRAENAVDAVERKFWYGTMSEYNALETIYATTIYVILDE